MGTFTEIRARTRGKDSLSGVNSTASTVPAMHIDLNADEAWEQLRDSRSGPPARANTGSRRKTYSAALEQAQQLFRAAAVVGPANPQPRLGGA